MKTYLSETLFRTLLTVGRVKTILRFMLNPLKDPPQIKINLMDDNVFAESLIFLDIE